MINASHMPRRQCSMILSPTNHPKKRSLKATCTYTTDHVFRQISALRDGTTQVQFKAPPSFPCFPNTPIISLVSPAQIDRLGGIIVLCHVAVLRHFRMAHRAANAGPMHAAVVPALAVAHNSGSSRVREPVIVSNYTASCRGVFLSWTGKWLPGAIAFQRNNGNTWRLPACCNSRTCN